ncbi:hypothetical protein [Mycobacterium asiaticum]|uniref:Uncharacterized protein n=1 Tax=Mycobacterium asiaticum TaxID=1790 RepID=A0A1A3KLA4_MYCAS|nr:hypothetical protein [Mycobacterium asiaticum]OBJ84741.1 hypothetical protein A5640_15010 [Mycobacterium asiaticum]
MAWSRILAIPARHGWTPNDLNQLTRDWCGAGHWNPDRPYKPIGLLGALLAWHGHENLGQRPAIYDEAREPSSATRRAPHPKLNSNRQLQPKLQRSAPYLDPGEAGSKPSSPGSAIAPVLVTPPRSPSRPRNCRLTLPRGAATGLTG